MALGAEEIEIELSQLTVRHVLIWYAKSGRFSTVK
jgi:hypothetical protein